MAVSPFAFYRGTAAVMAADLAPIPVTGLRAWLCGDCHLENFGLFATPEGREVFDLNDFDDTAPGPFEWDVLRLAASVALAARANGHAPPEQTAAATAAATGYREEMARLQTLGPLATWHERIDSVRIVEGWAAQHGSRNAREAERLILAARAPAQAGGLPKIARIVDGEPRIAFTAPFCVEPPKAVRARVGRAFARYGESLSPELRALVGRFRVVDVAQRVVGVGSVGLRSWIVLLVDGGEPLFLQLKQARRSAIEAQAGSAGFRNAARRVVTGQRTMQVASDVLLGWLREPDEGVDYYVRRLLDKRGSPRIERLRPPGLAIYAALCGGTLARAHARSGDAAAISGYLGRGSAFDTSIARFAATYADQAEQDHAAFLAAIAAGRIKAVPDARVGR
jgi:uncharacterized protein (DUF2252 family)